MKANNGRVKGKKKISFSLVTVPFLIFLFVVIALPVVVYLYHDNFFFASYHKDVIFSSMNDKKDSIERWFLDKKGALESLAEEPKFKEKFTFLMSSPDSTAPKKGLKGVQTLREQATGDLRKLLLSEVSNSDFSLISIISKEGGIEISSSTDLIGVSLAETDLFKNLISKTERTVFLGFWKESAKGYEIDIVCPLRDDKGDVQGYLHGAVNISGLVSIIARPYTKYMTFEIVDSQGSVLISPDTKLISSKKHSPLVLEVRDTLQYHEGAIVNVSALKNLRLFIMQRVEPFYVLYPLFEALLIYAIFVLMGFMLLLYQGLFVRSRVSKPLTKLLSFVRSSAAGVRSVVLQKNYPREIDNLINAVQQIINEFVFVRQQPPQVIDKKTDSMPVVPEKNLQRENPQGVEDLQQLAPLVELLDEASEQLKLSLVRDLSFVSKTTGDSAQQQGAYLLKRNTMMLSCVIDNYRFLQSSKSGIMKEALSIVRARDVFNEILLETDRLKEVFSVETVTEFDDSLESLDFEVNRAVLLRIIMNIIDAAYCFTNEGTITVMLLRSNNEEGRAFLNLYVSDTGVGYDNNELDLISKGEVSINPALSVAFVLSDIAGYDFKVSSIKDKGSVYNLRFRVDR